MEQFVVEIGYKYYTIPAEDIAGLLALAARCSRVEHTSDYKAFQPYEGEHDGGFITKVELQKIRRAEEKPSALREAVEALNTGAVG